MSKYSYVLFVIINLLKRKPIFKKITKIILVCYQYIYFILKLKFQFKIKKKRKERKPPTWKLQLTYIYVCTVLLKWWIEKNVIFFILIIIVEIISLHKSSCNISSRVNFSFIIVIQKNPKCDYIISLSIRCILLN